MCACVQHALLSLNLAFNQASINENERAHREQAEGAWSVMVIYGMVMVT